MNIYLNDELIFNIYDKEEEKYFKNNLNWFFSLWSKRDKEREPIYEKFYKTLLDGKNYIVASNGKLAFYWDCFKICKFLSEDLAYKFFIGKDFIKITPCSDVSPLKSKDFSEKIMPSKEEIITKARRCYDTIPSFLGTQNKIINYKYFEKIRNGFKLNNKTMCDLSIFKKEFSPVLFESLDFQDKKALLITCTC